MYTPSTTRSVATGSIAAVLVSVEWRDDLVLACYPQLSSVNPIDSVSRLNRARRSADFRRGKRLEIQVRVAATAPECFAACLAIVAMRTNR